MDVIKSLKVEEAQAQVDIWQYIFGIVPMAVVKCAIEHQIPDVLESHGGATTLPELSVAPLCDGIEDVGGDMFEMVLKADAAFLMLSLHDWNDDKCIQILRKCREAIPKDTGKVIIAEVVIVEGEDDKFTDSRLTLDMVILAHTEEY